MFNGGFEQTPLNQGLDWRHQPVPYLLVDFADPGAYHGRSCLRVDFTVRRNDQFLAAFQIVPVAPVQEYVLKAYVRSRNISSDSGPRLHVLDARCPSCVDAWSDTTIGSTPWHEISLRFSTGADTQLIELSIVRLRSRAFPTEITGTFWLDEVTLKAAGTASQVNPLKPDH